MASGSVFECGVCFVRYDDGGHRPLSLPCGHVFCEDCLGKLGRGEEVMCPLDLRRHCVKVGSLPCCYAILTNLPNEPKTHFACSKHSAKKIKFMCKVHSAFLCTDCVIEHTGSGHSILAHTANVSKVRTNAEEIASNWNRKLRDLQEKSVQMDSLQRRLLSHYDSQVNRVNQTYDSVIKSLNTRRNEHISSLKQHFSTQIRLLEAAKSRHLLSIDHAAKQTERLRHLLSSFLSSTYEDIHSLLSLSTSDLKKQSDDISFDPSILTFKDGIKMTDSCELVVEMSPLEVSSARKQPQRGYESGFSDSVGCHTTRHKSDSKTELELLDLVNGKETLGKEDRGAVTRRTNTKTRHNARNRTRKRSLSV